jgi:hypothetical protein
MPFSEVFWCEGFSGFNCVSALLLGIEPRPDLRPPETNIRAFAKQAGYKVERAERKKVLVLA